eukprot:TCONS_00008591-protein
MGQEDCYEIIQALRRDFHSLSDQNKIARRRALEKIGKETFEKKPKPDVEVLKTIFDQIYKDVLKLFSDPVDRTRETAIKLATKFLTVLNGLDNYHAYIIPTIKQRLTADEEPEPTEEIRLLLVETLRILIDLAGEQTAAFIDDHVNILQKTLVDSFPDVRKESCQCVRRLYEVSPQPFYMQGESLIKPLLKSLSHQHNKVRTAMIETIGITILGTSGKAVDEVFTHLAQRTFDHSGVVRLAVVNVVGRWLLELRDRYSFFSKLLPLLLSGFSDELPDIVNKSQTWFKQAGALYEEENEKDFKEKKEYLTQKHFEDALDHERPSLGCRALVQQNFSKILPAIINDITDWTPSTRIKSASLLYHMVYFCEDHVTMNIELLSQGLYRAAEDDEKEVVQHVLKTAELVGLFVEPRVYMNLIIPHLESVTLSPKSISRTLRILSCFVKKANYRLIGDEITRVCKTLSSPEISSTIDQSCQESLLECTNQIIAKNGINHSEFSKDLFKVLLNVTSLACNGEVKNQVKSQLGELSLKLNMTSSDDLFNMFGSELTMELKDSCKQWTGQSPEFYLYIAILSESKMALVSFLQTALEIFVQCSDASRDPEMRQKMFVNLSQLVLSCRGEESLIKELQQCALKLLRETVLPNCIWQAGRTAAAVRSVAISFLWAMLESGVITDGHLKESFKEIHTQIIACLDDHNETTRLVTVKVMLKLLQVCGPSFDVEQLHVIYPEVLKRLDDSSDDIRILATKALAAYFNSLPSNYDREFFQVHLEFIYKTLLIHMDDSHQNVQEAVYTCLKEGVQIHAGLLKNKVEDVKNKHRTKTYCEELSKLCESQLREV